MFLTVIALAVVKTMLPLASYGNGVLYIEESPFHSHPDMAEILPMWKDTVIILFFLVTVNM